MSIEGNEGIMQFNIDDVEVVNNTAARRFEAAAGGHLAVIDYIQEETRIIYTHTGVPEAIEHQGIAQKMAHTALEYASDNHLKVVPQCPFVAGYIDRHPEYQSLVWNPSRNPRGSENRLQNSI